MASKKAVPVKLVDILNENPNHLRDKLADEINGFEVALQQMSLGIQRIRSDRSPSYNIDSINLIRKNIDIAYSILRDIGTTTYDLGLEQRQKAAQA